MSESPDPEPKRQIGGELIIPLMALCFTLYYISTIIDSPWTAQVNAFLVGSILLVLILVFFVRSARDVLAGKASLGMSNLIEPRAILPKRLTFVVLTVFYFVAMPWLGFTLANFVFLFASMLLLSGGRRWPVSLLAAFLMSAISYGVFIGLFDKRLPDGPVELLLQGLF